MASLARRRGLALNTSVSVQCLGKQLKNRTTDLPSSLTHMRMSKKLMKNSWFYSIALKSLIFMKQLIKAISDDTFHCFVKKNLTLTIKKKQSIWLSVLVNSFFVCEFYLSTLNTNNKIRIAKLS